MTIRKTQKKSKTGPEPLRKIRCIQNTEFEGLRWKAGTGTRIKKGEKLPSGFEECPDLADDLVWDFASIQADPANPSDKREFRWQIPLKCEHRFPDPNVIRVKVLKLEADEDVRFRDGVNPYWLLEFYEEFVERKKKTGHATSFSDYMKRLCPNRLEQAPKGPAVEVKEGEHLAQVFREMDGLKWNEPGLELVFVSLNRIRVCVRGENQWFTYKQMGFQNKKKGKSKDDRDTRWLVLLAMAEKEGTLPGDSRPGGVRDIWGCLKDIRKRLRSLLGIEDGDPIPYDRKQGAWKTRFILKDETQGSENREDG